MERVELTIESLHPKKISKLLFLRFNLTIDLAELLIANSLNAIINPYRVLTELGWSKNSSLSNVMKLTMKLSTDFLTSHHFLFILQSLSYLN